ncbi:MAG: S9 family peptidase [Bernardetiaceae bacterium]
MQARFLFFMGLFLFSAFVQAQKQITIPDIYGRFAFYERSVQGVNWMKDGGFYTALSQDKRKVEKMDVQTGAVVATLFDGSSSDPAIAIDDYELSADEQKLLIQTERAAIYRRSFKANYYVYDLQTKKLRELSPKGKQSYATFSPDGSKVAFVRDNNLFYVDLASGEEFQITGDGRFNHVINGSTDWVYEEELGFAKAFFWSPDSEKIAYYRFDESMVKEYNMQVWEGKNALYPTDYRFKYPKAGEQNARVKLFVYHLTPKKIVGIDVGDTEDAYLPRVQWTNDANLLSFKRMNRLQNHLQHYHANATTGQSDLIYEEKSDTYVDVEYTDDLIYLKDGKHFICTSERDGYKHAYLYQMDGTLVRQITTGNWEMLSFIGVDESPKKPLIYYISTEDSPLERHFYQIDIEGKKKTKISTTAGTHEIDMSPDFRYYLHYFSNAQTPKQVRLVKTAKHEVIKLLEENKDLVKSAKDYGLVAKEFFDFRTEDGTTLYGYLLKPAQIDTDKKYPLLMHVYGGPASQKVLHAWGDGFNYAWHQMLVQQGYIVAVVDNRGTNARGAAFKKATYAQLGKYETQDQIEAVQHLLGKHNFLDKDRVGIWGWSYGGYMTALCMTLGADVFKLGVSVAPVSTWRLYDTIYTERFLKRPQDNPEGYDKYSPISHVDKLKGDFLLIHGTGDDNVHFQNAVLLQDALIRAGKQFQSFYYPDRNHGIYGGNTRIHLYEMMTQFIQEKL